MAGSPHQHRPLRVVTLVAKPGTFGGAERIAAEVTKRLDPARFTATFCMSRPPPDPNRAGGEGFPAFAEDLRAAGVRLVVLARRSRLDLAAWWPLLTLLRRDRVDVLHSHMFGSNVSGVVLGRLAGVPAVVAHEHTWSFQGKPLRRFLDRELIARFSDAFVAVSREDRRRMIEIEGIAPDDVVFIPNGVPAGQAPEPIDKRPELGIGPDELVVGTVGVLRPQKALDVLIRAAAILAPRFPALKVVIVGPGGQRQALDALISELKLEGVVRMLGARTDVPDLLRAFDVAVCSSDFEGSPLSVMEYMEAGLPTVSTRVGGVPDLIEDGVHGLLVEPQDPPALAAAMETLLSDREARERMGASARERRLAEFEIDVMVRRLERLYTDLLEAKGVVS